MSCSKTNNCPCPKETCANHGVCCDCVARHIGMDGVPYCIFPATDKSLESFYKSLKDRFEEK